MSEPKQDIEVGLPEHSNKYYVSLSCCSSLQLCWYYKLATLENFLHIHHWKVFSVLLLLVLLCLGLKFAKSETDFYRLWVAESSRLSSEMDYLARTLHSAYMQQTPSYTGSIYQQYSPTSWVDPYFRSPDSHPSGNSQSSTNSPLGGLPGSEFMGSLESILQVSDSNLLTPDALRDHMELLLKIHSIEVKVGTSKWRLEDLCQRADLPSAAGLHSFESLLAKLIPCVVITPLDCFWEGSKLLAPDAVVPIPWPNNQYTLKWPSLDPHHLLSSFRAQYGNDSEFNYLDEVSDMLDRTGLRHGYLTRPCLDPQDRGCPKLAPNYKSQPPDIASVVAKGCPSFAANILHWPKDLLLGGQRCSSASPGNQSSSEEECSPNQQQRLTYSSALQSLLLLRSPQELYRTVRFNDPYKHESWTLLDAQNVLDQWRNELKHYLIVHNKAIAPSRDWKYYGFTDNSLRDLLTQSTVRIWFAQLAGAIILVLLYGMVCLLCWREPSRSQCWLALAGLGLIVLSLVAGLGICSLIGLPFNVLSVQVLPFLILGLGMGELFVFTTCNTCVLSRSAEVNQKNVLWTTHVLAEHGTAFLFSLLTMVATFFAALYQPVPVMRQFCLQSPDRRVEISIHAHTLWVVASSATAAAAEMIELEPRQRGRDCAGGRLPFFKNIYVTHNKPFRSRQTVVLKRPSADIALLSLSTRKIIPTTRLKKKPSLEYSICIIVAVPYLGWRNSSTSSKYQLAERAGILVLVQAVTIMTLFPALLKLDTRRRARHRMDVLCCLRQPVSVTAAAAAGTSSPPPLSPSYSLPPLNSPPSPIEGVVRVVETTSTKVRLSGNAVATVKVSVSTQKQPSALIHGFQPCGGLGGRVVTTTAASGVLSVCLCSSCQYDISGSNEFGCRSCHNGPLFVRLVNQLASALSRFPSIRVIICLLGASLLFSAAVLAPLRLRIGLNLLSLIPTDAIEHGFVEKSSDTFGLIHFQLIARGSDSGHSQAKVTRHDDALHGPGVDFARSQKQLRALFTDVIGLPGVSYTGKKIWLDSFRDWLLGLQKAFDSDVDRGFISLQGNWTVSASEDGVLGLLLMVQTDIGIDRGRIRTGRLVRDEVIDPSAFRVYLHAWRVLDAFNYTAPPCTIIPDPSPQLSRFTPLNREGGPDDLYVIQPAAPIQLVQTSFFARGYGDVTDQIEFVRKVRALTEQAISRGVPVFPTGLPFTLAEHYLTFWHHFCVSSGILVGTALVVGLIFLPQPIAALLAVCIGGGGAVSACLLGFVALGLDLNAISGGMVLISFGLGTKLSSEVLCGWYGPQHNIHRRFQSQQVSSSRTSPSDLEGKDSLEGDIETTPPSPTPLRVKKLFAVLQNHISQIVHANVSFVLAVALLAAVRVDFIANHFFRLVGIISLACLFDSLILLPTICFVLEPVFPSSLYSVSSPSLPSVHIRHDVETTITSDSQVQQRDTLPSDSSPFINTRDVDEVDDTEEDEEEDLAMRRLCDSLKRSSSESTVPGPKYTPPAVIDLFTSALRNVSRQASLSTISEEPSNSSSTLSLHPPPPPPSLTPPQPPPSTSHHHQHHHHYHLHHRHHNPATAAATAVRMKEFLPLLNAAMAVAQRHHQQQQHSRRNAGSEPPPPPYSEHYPPPALR
ncbi:hypothetical protein Aperf_G00000010674 [Anoplocephala perfoliata]